jgi:hypothetical protein
MGSLRWVTEKWWRRLVTAVDVAGGWFGVGWWVWGVWVGSGLPRRFAPRSDGGGRAGTRDGLGGVGAYAPLAFHSVWKVPSLSVLW